MKLKKLFYTTEIDNDVCKKFESNIKFIENRLNELEEDLIHTKLIAEQFLNELKNKNNSQNNQKDMRSIYKVIKILINEVIDDE